MNLVELLPHDVLDLVADFLSYHVRALACTCRRARAAVGRKFLLLPLSPSSADDGGDGLPMAILPPPHHRRGGLVVTSGRPAFPVLAVRLSAGDPHLCAYGDRILPTLRGCHWLALFAGGEAPWTTTLARFVRAWHNAPWHHRVHCFTLFMDGCAFLVVGDGILTLPPFVAVLPGRYHRTKRLVLPNAHANAANLVELRRIPPDEPWRVTMRKTADILLLAPPPPPLCPAATAAATANHTVTPNSNDYRASILQARAGLQHVMAATCGGDTAAIFTKRY
jgi:hypothetical protein